MLVLFVTRRAGANKPGGHARPEFAMASLGTGRRLLSGGSGSGGGGGGGGGSSGSGGGGGGGSSSSSSSSSSNRLGLREEVFQRSLAEVIRGTRSAERRGAGSAAYRKKAVEEAAREARTSDDVDGTKATALAKLFFFHMNGVDAEWAAFQAIEVASSPRLQTKGRLQSLDRGRDVLDMKTVACAFRCAGGKQLWDTA